MRARSFSLDTLYSGKGDNDTRIMMQRKGSICYRRTNSVVNGNSGRDSPSSVAVV